MGTPLSSHEKTVDQNRSQKLGLSAIFVRVAIDSIETFTSSIGRSGIGVVTSAIDRMKCMTFGKLEVTRFGKCF